MINLFFIFLQFGFINHVQNTNYIRLSDSQPNFFYLKNYIYPSSFIIKQIKKKMFMVSMHFSKFLQFGHDEYNEIDYVYKLK